MGIDALLPRRHGGQRIEHPIQFRRILDQGADQARQRDRIEGYLQSAIDEGGSFAVGGGRSPKFDRGYYIDPTLVVGLDNSANVAREEVVGARQREEVGHLPVSYTHLTLPTSDLV